MVDLENRFCLSYLREFDRLITALKVRKFPFLEVSPIITIMSMLWLLKQTWYPDRRFQEKQPAWIGILFIFLRFWCKLLKGSVSCDNGWDDRAGLSTGSLQGTAF